MHSTDWLVDCVDRLCTAALADALRHVASETGEETVLDEDNVLNTNDADEVDDELTFYRFYHVFREHELDELVASIADCRIVDSYYDHANWCVVVEKTTDEMIQ